MNPWVQLFRVLLPSWRFFDRPFVAPRLYVALRESEWREIRLRRSRRGILELFVNPVDTRAFSFHSVLDQWVEEIETGTAEGVSYEIARNYCARELAGSGDAPDFRMKLERGDRVLYES